MGLLTVSLEKKNLFEELKYTLFNSNVFILLLIIMNETYKVRSRRNCVYVYLCVCV